MFHFTMYLDPLTKILIFSSDRIKKRRNQKVLPDDAWWFEELDRIVEKKHLFTVLLQKTDHLEEIHIFSLEVDVASHTSPLDPDSGIEVGAEDQDDVSRWILQAGSICWAWYPQSCQGFLWGDRKPQKNGGFVCFVPFYSYWIKNGLLLLHFSSWSNPKFRECEGLIGQNREPHQHEL